MTTRAERFRRRAKVAGTISSAAFASGDQFVVGHWTGRHRGCDLGPMVEFIRPMNVGFTNPPTRGSIVSVTVTIEHAPDGSTDRPRGTEPGRRWR